MQKAAYDGAGRVKAEYTTDGGGDASWSDALNVTGDAVLQQVETTYDADGNVILVTARQRFHDETGTGALGTPASGVHACVSYLAYYYDAANRLTAAADVGTNGGGSGSTLVACEQAGRNAFLMELDPLYCDVIAQRYERFTGKKAARQQAA